MPDDFIYTVNQVALILNKSDKTVRTYAAEGLLETTKKNEEGSGIEKVFISASSIADLAERKKLALNFAALEEYTSDRPLLERTFQRARLTRESEAGSSTSPSNAPPTGNPPPAVETPVVAFLREQLGKLEAEKEELKRDLKEKDRQLEEKNGGLIAAIRESNDKYQLIALAKEQIEARLAKLVEHTRILHLSTNRDIRRLQAGKLQAGDLSPLPLPSEIRIGEYEAEVNEPSEGRTDREAEETVIDISPEVLTPAAPLPEQTEIAAPASSFESPSTPTPPRREKTPKKRRKAPQPERRAEKEQPPAKKKGFFSRLFGA
ncbi:MAG TPA: hypothetical protein VLB76_10250 [Thermoanaerobaculia bacterium]|jgi:hypothetical protein|nr:hypothetical protein [Thermoanaerobaculia bacterium]